MNSFNEKDVPKVPVVLMGGPLDGQKYAMPVPPGHAVPISVTVPLKQPASSAPFARYGRALGDEPIAGFHVFLFEECVGPNGEQVLYAPPEDVAPEVVEVPEVLSTPI